jgi:chromosomal replication initiator protein
VDVPVDNRERVDSATDDIAERIWEQASTRLRTELGESTWHAWFDAVRPLRFQHDILVLTVPSNLTAERIRSGFHPSLDNALKAAAGRELAVELLVDTETRADEPVPHPTPSSPAAPAADAPAASPAPSENMWASGTLNDRYTFDQFVIGASNRFAHAAALAVAEAPAQAYNPLFIYGGTGLGKTHLLQGIGHYVRQHSRRMTTRYVTSETFMNEFIDAVRDRGARIEGFKRRYRNYDVLLVDDIQFIEGKERIQEEFFHTFNSLYEGGAQIVLSSDRPPREIATLEERLRSRFEWGLLTDIQAPDLETRIAILRKKAAQERLVAGPEVLEFIASRIQTNIRELEGALIRVTAFASLNRQQVDLALAEIVLKDLIPEGGEAQITTGMIMAQTASYFDITIDDLCGQSRTHVLVTARQIAMYLCRELTDLSLPKIGQQFGGRDHTTVLHACRVVKELRDSQTRLTEDYQNLLRTLTG